MTFDEVLAKIDREAAACAVAESLVFLGGRLEWGSGEFAAVQESLLRVVPDGLPEVSERCGSGARSVSRWAGTTILRTCGIVMRIVRE